MPTASADRLRTSKGFAAAGALAATADHWAAPGRARSVGPRRTRAVVPAPLEYAVFPTEIGWMAAAADHDALVRLTIGADSAVAAARALLAGLAERSAAAARIDLHAARSTWWNDLSLRLQAYAQGEVVALDQIPVNLEHATPFQRRVLAACRRVGSGDTLTYGELATAAGAPGSARAVGSVMARNTCPLVIPCHRIVRAGGGLGGFSAPQGVLLKRRLLELERRARRS